MLKTARPAESIGAAQSGAENFEQAVELALVAFGGGHGFRFGELVVIDSSSS